MIITASGGLLTRKQALRTWDKTVHPLGKKLGLLTGYVKPQEGTSKRTAADKPNLVRDWHVLVTQMIEKVRQRAMEVLQDAELVELMMPTLMTNMDEECLHAMGKNTKIAGSAGRKKHDNQNASSRHFLFGHNVVAVGASCCS